MASRVTLALLACSYVIFGSGGTTWTEEPPADVEDEVERRAYALGERADAHWKARRYREAVTDYREALRLLRIKGGDHKELATCLNNLAYMLNSLGQADKALPLYEEALKMRKRLFGGDHPDVASGLNNLAAVLSSLGKLREAVPLYEESLEMYRRLFEGNHLYVATSLNNLAAALESLGRASEALPLHEEALVMFRRLLGGDHPHVATGLNNLANVLESLGRASEALPLHEEALKMRKRLHADGHPDVATSLNNLAGVLESLGRASKALPLYEEALKMRERLYAGDHPEVATSLDNLAYVLKALGKTNEALPLHEQALKMRKRLYAGDHPEVATSLNNVASMLSSLGKAIDALPLHEEALKMRRRLYAGDHPHVATSLNNVASVLESLGKSSEALPLSQEALKMLRRLHAGDHPEVATSLNNLGYLLDALGKASEALPLYQEALQMNRRLFEGDHPRVATSLNNLAGVLKSLGKSSEALPLYREALRMLRRMYAGDHSLVAASLNNLADVLKSLGKASKALPLYEEALAMRKRLFEGDHPDAARSLNNLGYVLSSLGKASEALSLFDEALRMRRRLHEGDHPHVAASLNNVAYVLKSLGKASEALPLYEEALKMRKRLFEGDHPDVAASLNNLAGVLDSLGKASATLSLYEEAFKMYRRLFGGDHPDVATSLNNLAAALNSVGKAGEALPYFEESLKMRKRLFRGDHPDVALSLNNLAGVLEPLGRATEALPLYEEALKMSRHLFEGDHPDVALILTNLAYMLTHLDRRDEAEKMAQEAIQVGERCHWLGCYMSRVNLSGLYLRDAKVELATQVLQPAVVQLETRRAEAFSLGSEGRSQYLAELRQWDPFPLLVRAHVMQGEPDRALEVLERSRGREMLDLLKRGEGDPLRTVLASAGERGDEALVRRIKDVELLVQETASRVAMASSQSKRARESQSRPERRAAREAEREARKAHADALKDRLRVIRDALPEGRPLSAEEMQALLEEGERMLAFSLGERSFVFVVSRDGIQAHALGTDERPVTSRAIAAAVAAYRDTLSEAGATPTSAGEHPGAALFEMLMPEGVWQDVESASRVYLLPHASLHQLPFEALVVAAEEDKPVYWLQEGPPIAYAASAAVLGALRERPRATSNAAVVAVGDPLFDGASNWPSTGVVVTGIAPKTQAAATNLRPGDVITSYGGTPTPSYEDLVTAIRGTDASVAQVALGFERDGRAKTVSLKPGHMGVFLAKEAPPIAGPKLLQTTTVGVIRSATRGRLRPLPGTRDEVDALATLIGQSKRPVPVDTLLGAEATEAALFEASNSPRILHLATHGLIEPDLGARASRLALTPPRVPVPGNDGFLSLGDLLERWRSRLKGTELVVLSACDSHSGKLDANEGMLALPWGFCFAGARSCIASLWQVDDASTAKLMTSLYRGLFQRDDFAPCEALHAARLALFNTHPDPYHWAPFLFVGAP